MANRNPDRTGFAADKLARRQEQVADVCDFRCFVDYLVNHKSMDRDAALDHVEGIISRRRSSADLGRSARIISGDDWVNGSSPFDTIA